MKEIVKRILSVIMTAALLVSVISAAGCNKPEEPEKIVSPADTSPTDVVEPFVPEEPIYGQIKVVDGQLCSEDGEPIQLRGLSTSGLMYAQFRLNEGCIGTLKDDWGIDVFRLAMYTYEDHVGYPTHKEQVLPVLEDAIEVCQKLNLYYIVDWHILYDGDPLMHKDDALEFFDYISEKYGDDPHLIYEICNEPNTKKTGYEVTWENNVRPYAVEVIDKIRANDPDNIIIVGSTDFSKDLDIVAKHPLEGENIMYTMHFYAGSHGEKLRKITKAALNAGLPVFVTEWGMTKDTGTGSLFEDETETWLKFLDENKLSSCMWQYGSSINEDTNVLLARANMEGNWPDDEIAPAGKYFKEIMARYK